MTDIDYSNGGKGAFACVSESSFLQKGLTKREYFAAAAMQGMLSAETKVSDEILALYSLEAADALLSALEEKPNE